MIPIIVLLQMRRGRFVFFFKKGHQFCEFMVVKYCSILKVKDSLYMKHKSLKTTT